MQRRKPTTCGPRRLCIWAHAGYKPNAMLIATWNVNSVNARLPRLLDWLKERAPDVVCLQETKTIDADFPHAAIAEAGYQVACHGQKSYNGVALLSRHPIHNVVHGMGHPELDVQARLIAGTVLGVRIISCYVPNGATLTDDKYAFKLAWLKALRAHLDAAYSPDEPLVLAGDFNVATRDVDLTDPPKWHKTVLAHPSVREAFAHVTDFDLVDVFAAHHPLGGLFSWWDYRTNSYGRGAGGLRIDGLLATPCVSGRAVEAMIDEAQRGLTRPSDHVPVLMRLVPAPGGIQPA
jgi:exodeoxyribonuclease-3